MLSVIHAESLEDAIEIVNGSRYGNGTSIFTESGAAVRKYRHDVEVGMVGVNIGVAAPVAFFPFSGWKDSFFGDLHAHGTDAVDFFTRKKTDHVALLLRRGDRQVLRRAGGAPLMATVDQATEAQVRKDDRDARLPLLERPGADRPAARRRGRGLLVLGLRGQPLPRLRLAARQRVDRPPAPEDRAGDQGSGRPALHHRAEPRQRQARRAGARCWPSSRPATST